MNDSLPKESAKIVVNKVTVSLSNVAYSGFCSVKGSYSTGVAGGIIHMAQTGSYAPKEINMGEYVLFLIMINIFISIVFLISRINIYNALTDCIFN